MMMLSHTRNKHYGCHTHNNGMVVYPFTPPPPPKNKKIQNFEKMKKIAGDVILHMCIKNHNHMMYGS